MNPNSAKIPAAPKAKQACAPVTANELQGGARLRQAYVRRLVGHSLGDAPSRPMQHSGIDGFSQRVNICFFLCTAAILLFSGCLGGNDGNVMSRSYKGHENDADISNFVNAYPKTAGSRLDDCATCHTQGKIEGKKGPITINACDYCHHIKEGKQDFAKSLNTFGKEYKDEGRKISTFNKIASKDSDNDGYTNFTHANDAGQLS